MKTRISWKNLTFIIVGFFVYWFLMDWSGQWKMNVDQCTTAIASQLDPEVWEPLPMAKEMCENLQESGVVK